MNITIGFIAVFISIIIPGLLFLRFYFFGEFSKQFTTKEPVVRSLIYSIIPGLLIQFFGLLCYANFYKDGFVFSKIIEVHRELFGDSKLSEDSITFIDNGLFEFGVYSLLIFFLAIASGYLSSRLIRLFGFDRKYKLFRYKNLWCYIFRAEILGFKKFREAITTLNRPDLDKRNVDMVFADVLVDSSNGTQLYTGYVVDYDLNSSDISKLERIYLFDAKRYKKTSVKDANSPTGLKTIVSPKSIAGSVFILPVDSLININLLYVTSEKQQRTTFIKGLRKKMLYIGLAFVFLLFMIGMTYYGFVKASWFNAKWYTVYFENTGWFDRIIGCSLYVQVLGIFMPTKGEEEDKLSFFNDTKAKLVVFGLLALLFLALNYSWVF